MRWNPLDRRPWRSRPRRSAWKAPRSSECCTEVIEQSSDQTGRKSSKMKILKRCARASLHPSPAMRRSRSIPHLTRHVWSGYCWNLQKRNTQPVARMDVQSLCCILGKRSSGPSTESERLRKAANPPPRGTTGARRNQPNQGQRIPNMQHFVDRPQGQRRLSGWPEQDAYIFWLSCNASLEKRFFFDIRAIGSSARGTDAPERTWGTHTGRCPDVD